MKKPKQRTDKPHPINLKELKAPLMQKCSEMDRSIPYLVRVAVREWLNRQEAEKGYEDIIIPAGYEYLIGKKLNL